MDDMMEQLVNNFDRLGAMNHGLADQGQFDKSAKVPDWNRNSHSMQFRIQMQGITVEFPIQWRDNPRLLVAEFAGAYAFLVDHLIVKPGKIKFKSLTKI